MYLPNYYRVLTGLLRNRSDGCCHSPSDFSSRQCGRDTPIGRNLTALPVTERLWFRKQTGTRRTLCNARSLATSETLRRAGPDFHEGRRDKWATGTHRRSSGSRRRAPLRLVSGGSLIVNVYPNGECGKTGTGIGKVSLCSWVCDFNGIFNRVFGAVGVWESIYMGYVDGWRMVCKVLEKVVQTGLAKADCIFV